MTIPTSATMFNTDHDEYSWSSSEEEQTLFLVLLDVIIVMIAPYSLYEDGTRRRDSGAYVLCTREVLTINLVRYILTMSKLRSTFLNYLKLVSCDNLSQITCVSTFLPKLWCSLVSHGITWTFSFEIFILAGKCQEGAIPNAIEITCGQHVTLTCSGFEKFESHFYTILLLFHLCQGSRAMKKRRTATKVMMSIWLTFSSFIMLAIP